ncbi:MAG: hypothetical protein QXG00_05975, partial [Candidatus Woesearchaeota archaeon]
KIREGVGRVEFEFIGQGKTNSQQPGPESFGARERQDMRDIVSLNKIKTSTHAALHSQSLAGLTKEGFEGFAQQMALKEIEKAINFAAEATKGGAVVFHLQEWMRPISEVEKKPDKRVFKGYEEEPKDATFYVVDDRTGRFVGQISKDQKIYVPKFETVKDKFPEKIGKIDEKTGKKIRPDDWIDINGNIIPKDTSELILLFNRVPKWKANETRFDVEEKDWNYFEKEAKEWNANPENKDKQRTPEEMFLINQYQNEILSLRGNSLYHGRYYEREKHRKDKIEQALKFYEELDKNIPEKEKWKLMQKTGEFGGLIPDDVEHPIETLKKMLKETKDTLRHTHEASASADARAQQYEKMLEHLKPIKVEGLKRTTETIAQAALKAREYTQLHKNELDENIYVAPENWDPHYFGSHPDEISEVIRMSREKMAEKLKSIGYSEENAKKEAAKYIKATIDLGHMNIWRQFFKGDKEYKDPQEREEAFKKWYLDKLEGMAKKGYIGHIHLTDNMGFDDEHLTPGQGNAPIREALLILEKHGLKEFIIEPGSFNTLTAMYDTWAEFGSPVYGFERAPSFRGFRHSHFGYTAAPTYIVGAYSPSNEWKLWSEVPLE